MSSSESMGSRDWKTPGVHEVVPGVYRVPLPLPNDGLRAVNVYVIIDGDALTVIDSGWALPESREVLGGALASLGYRLDDVRRFLMTHVHRDHYTFGVELRRSTGTSLALGHGEEPSIDVLTSSEHLRLEPQIALLQKYGASEVIEILVTHGAGLPTIRGMWERPDVWLEDGQEIALSSRTLKVMATPGHTRGHVVYVDEDEGLLFAGDHVLPHITPSIGFEASPANLPLKSFLQSLARIKSLPDMQVLPAHGPVGLSSHERADEIRAHHDRRLEEIVKAVVNGHTTAPSAARELGWTGRGIPFNRLDPFNMMLAVLETAAHLELLVAMGRLGAYSREGYRCFEPVSGA